MNLSLALDLFAVVTVVYGFVLFTVVTVRFKWIIERFEANTEIINSPLFFPYRPKGMKTFSYVCELISLDLIPDALVEYGIRRGHVPPHTSRAAVQKFFTTEELRKLRRAKWAIAVFFGALFALVASDWFLPVPIADR